MRNPVERTRRLRDGTNWRTFMRLLRLDDLMTSYTHARPIAIPEKSVFRLVSRLLVHWATGTPVSAVPVLRTWHTSASALLESGQRSPPCACKYLSYPGP